MIKKENSKMTIVEKLDILNLLKSLLFLKMISIILEIPGLNLVELAVVFVCAGAGIKMMLF